MFADELAAAGIRLTPEQISRFDSYLVLLQKWSKRMNLVADASDEVVRRRHFGESIALGAALREREALPPGARVIDIGTGAGFPGVPIKIVWPQIRLTLLEATAKKAAFLSALVEALALADVQIVSARAEDAAHDPSLRAQFDLVLARALAPLPTSVELTLPFARVGGRVVAPKGSRVHDELAAAQHALSALGGKALIVPFHAHGRPQHLVVIVKQRETPPEYPRRPGMPRKRPL